jgi:hypothetical protein
LSWYNFLKSGGADFKKLYTKEGAVKKKRNKARGFPRYGSPRALIYHTAKKNYLILKKGYSKHSGTKTAFLPIIKMLKNIFFRLLF